MNHKILEQIKGGAFLARDLPMSTSSNYYRSEEGSLGSESLISRLPSGYRGFQAFPCLKRWEPAVTRRKVQVQVQGTGTDSLYGLDKHLV